MGKRLGKALRELGISELAEELDLNEESIRRHLRRVPAPPYSKESGPKGRLRFNAAEYQAWMDSQGLTGERGRPSEHADSPDLEKARLRKENALAAKYELQVQRERGELVPIQDVKQWIGEHVGATRSKLIGFGAAVTPQLEGRDAAERQDILESRIRDILDELTAEAGRLCGG